MCIRCVREWAAALVAYTQGVEDQLQRQYTASVVAPSLVGYSVTVADLAELVRLLDLCTVERPEPVTREAVRARVMEQAGKIPGLLELLPGMGKDKD